MNSNRQAAVAGQFYPLDAGRLRADVENYIASAGVEPAPEQVVGLVSPHAGYMYSGPTAGYAFARVMGKQPKRVVLLGCSHRYAIDTASVYGEGEFATPLGAFPIDELMAQDLACETQSATTEPHTFEHAIEVQLPFLAVAVGIVPIVPVLFGARATDWHERLGAFLAGKLDKDDLVIASTDLSHSLPEPEANRIDEASIAAVLKRDWQDFVAGTAAGRYSMCGSTAVATAMACCEVLGATQWQLLDYRTSASASGDYNRVVGYAAISMEKAA